MRSWCHRCRVSEPLVTISLLHQTAGRLERTAPSSRHGPARPGHRHQHVRREMARMSHMGADITGGRAWSLLSYHGQYQSGQAEAGRESGDPGASSLLSRARGARAGPCVPVSAGAGCSVRQSSGHGVARSVPRRCTELPGDSKPIGLLATAVISGASREARYCSSLCTSVQTPATPCPLDRRRCSRHHPSWMAGQPQPAAPAWLLRQITPLERRIPSSVIGSCAVASAPFCLPSGPR